MVGKGPENWVHVSLLENFGGGVGGFRRNEVPFITGYYFSVNTLKLLFDVHITLDNLLFNVVMYVV